MTWLALAAVLLAGTQAFATMVRQMNLGEMTANADRIVHGTVTSIETGTVTAGGAELPIIKYQVRIAEVLKGNVSPNEDNLIDVIMIGSLKTNTRSGELTQFHNVFEGPNLRSGNQYLLFLTRPSSIGLSTTVGVGQGAFRFLNDGTVMNEAKNVGLFRDMDGQGLPASGPINYSALEGRIQQLLGN